MKRFILSIIALGVILILGSVIAFTVLERPDLIPQKHIDTLDPLWQTQNLTSFFLIRRIEDLRDTAVYVQNKEEGKKILELFEVEEYMLKKQSTDVEEE